MTKKIFSSREDDDLADIETTQELVFVMHDVLGKDEDPDEDPELVQLQLEAGVMDMAELIETQRHQIHMLSMDLIQLSLNHTLMMRDLKVSAVLLEALSLPVIENDPFLKALAILKREGDPEITTVGNDANGIEIDVKLTYSENDLAEALKLALGEYIDCTAEETLKVISP